MPKTVYLLGAGASCGVLPVVKEIPDKIKNTIKEFEQLKLANFESDFRIDKIIEDLNWLYNELEFHFSFDTAARKYSLRKDRNKLIKLKVIFTLFFNYLELRYKFDKRYDAFLATILRDDLSMPDDITILSWNYDSQIERAYSNYFYDPKIDVISKKLNICSNIDSLATDSKIIKLNGSLNIMQKGYDENINFTYKSIENFYNSEPDYPRFIRDWNKVSTNYNEAIPNVTFAFESVLDENLEINLKKILKDTEIFTVVGYSFPRININIDRKILNMLNNVQYYIIQDLNPEKILDRLSNLILNGRKVPKIGQGAYFEDPDQFYIPQL